MQKSQSPSRSLARLYELSTLARDFMKTTLSNVCPHCRFPVSSRSANIAPCLLRVTKLQRGHYTEVKHDAIFELRPLPYRILPLPSCAIQILRGVLKTRAIRAGLWENNPSKLLEDSRELAESLTRSLLGFTSRISSKRATEVGSVRRGVSSRGSMRAACSSTFCHVTLRVTKAPIQSWPIDFHPGFSVLFPVFDLYCGVRFRVTLHLV